MIARTDGCFFHLLVLLTITQVVARCFPQNPRILSIRKICSSLFLRRAVALVLVAPHVALHRVSIRTLDDLSCCKLGVGWGSRGESMLPFLVRPLGPKRARSHGNTESSQKVNIVDPQAAFT
jgi:hypothetical protein